MSHDYSVDQNCDVQAPRAGEMIAISVDATSHGYDLTKLVWNGTSVVKLLSNNSFFVSIQCELNDVYFLFDQAPVGTNTIDDTSVITPGTALSLPAVTSTTGAPDYIRTFTAAVPPMHLVAGLPTVDYRINRLVDKTLILKCAAGKTATFRIGPSSKNLASADR